MAAPVGITPPPRGTRPRNRRQLIIEAAGELIHRDGYPHVAMTDIADAVAVRASALYRHFPGKQDLLAEVLVDQLTSLRRRLEAGEDLAQAAIAHRRLGVLWLRETRNLEPARRGEIDDAIEALVGLLTPTVTRPQPDPRSSELLAWCLLAVLISSSFHQIQLPGTGLVDLVRGLADAVQHVQVPSATARAEDESGLHPLVARSRREQILAAAITLFAERGYLAVGVEDIGAASGMAGTSIYRHFDTKADVLLAAMNRGAEWLRLDLNRTLAQARTPADGLRGLLDSYMRFVLDETDLLDVMLGETSHLPEAERDRIRQTQRDYIAEWVHLLEQVHPAESRDVARVRVQAALTSANTIARVRRLRAMPGLVDAYVAVGAALFALPD